MKYLLNITIFCLGLNSFSQTINYADSVIDFSSQFAATSWSANQTLGYPNTYPSYGDLVTAWAHSTADGQREYIELNFSNPMPIDSVWIYETYNGGSVDTIYVKNPGTNNWEIVYSGSVSAVTSAQIFKVGFPMTSFSVSDIRIAMDSPSVSSWNEIDAVAIVNSTPINATICDGDSLLISSTYQDSPGVYADSITADADIEMITLSTAATTFNTITETACDAYTSPSGLYVWTTSNTYMDTITNTAGCDSILTIDLTINTTNASTTTSGGTISATTSGADYQWVDCNNSFAIISNETAQDYTPSANGSYAVIVTENGCSDTSSCVAITDVGVNENNQVKADLYPNPVQNELTISADTPIESVVIVDMTGREVYRNEQIGALTEKVNFYALAKGIYHVVVQVDGLTAIQKVMH